MALTLAIDLGTTNLKIGLIDETGDILSAFSAPTPTFKNEEGGTEHDPVKLKELIKNLCEKTLTQKSKAEVAYVITSTYQFGLMMLDEHKEPLTGMTLLTDTRSQHTFSEFLSEYGTDNIYQKTGCPFISQYVLPRLFYFHYKKKDTLQKAKYFTDSKAFLFEWLTGKWVTDMSTAAATQFYNLHQYKWDKGLLSTLDLSPEQFPAVEDGTKYKAPLKPEICRELGLKTDVQVVLGLYDGAALGIGLSGLEPEVGIINLGTTAMLRVPGTNPIFDQSENKRIQAYPVQKNFFLNGGALNNASLPLHWIRDHLFDFDVQDPSLAEISDSPPLITLPYLTGERDSLIGPYASGVFFGIQRRHTQKDFVRSVLEGVAYSLRYIYEALQENQLSVKEIRMGGGGINIKVWPQIFADVLNLPVNLHTGKEMGLVGNAILAFTAGGEFEDFKEAHLRMSIGNKRIEPNHNKALVRNQHYIFFKKLRENIGALYKEHTELP